MLLSSNYRHPPQSLPLQQSHFTLPPCPCILSNRPHSPLSRTQQIGSFPDCWDLEQNSHFSLALRATASPATPPATLSQSPNSAGSTSPPVPDYCSVDVGPVLTSGVSCLIFLQPGRRVPISASLALLIPGLGLRPPPARAHPNMSPRSAALPGHATPRHLPTSEQWPHHSCLVCLPSS